MNRRTYTRFILLIVVMLLATWLAPSALALPPRPDPQPTAMPKPGGFIELTVESAPTGLWTVVQWQDALSGWHDVTGWQGALDVGGTKTWWVDKADYGKGPFRWAFTQSGELVAASESFYLPLSADKAVAVSVSLAP